MNKREIRTKFLLRKLSKVYNAPYAKNIQNLSNLALKNVLIISPHADDEVIGCGAAINYFVKKQIKVTVLVVTKESHRSIAKNYDYTAEQRIEESYRAMEVLGYSKLEYFDFPELELNKNEILRQEFQKQLNSFLLELKPECVFIPNFNEIHPDHRAIGKLSRDIIVEGKRTNILSCIKNLLIYEVWGPVFMNTYLEISKDGKQKKEESISCYKSQLASVDYKAMINFIGRFRRDNLIASQSIDINKQVKMFEGYQLFEENDLEFMANTNNKVYESKWSWN